MSWPHWAELEAYIRHSAEAHRISPALAVEIAALESGHGAHMIGDHNSSFGPFQLHYGGLSARFPHPGLGNIFTHSTGLSARNPETWKRQVDFACASLAQGKGPQWSTYRKAVAMVTGHHHIVRGGPQRKLLAKRRK